jgi:antitoxin VapB
MLARDGWAVKESGKPRDRLRLASPSGWQRIAGTTVWTQFPESGAATALSIKTAEADELARSLAQLTGENMTDAVTIALRERLARERNRRESAAGLPARLIALSSRLRVAYDTRPVSRGAWDAAAGDEE